MKRNDVLVIRIGLSIECADQENVAVTVEPQDHGATDAVRCRTVPSRAPAVPQPPPRRSFGRGDSQRDAELGEKRAMTDMQRKVLFRIAYETGDRDSALNRILGALGVERLEWATRAQASKAIDLLGKRKNGSAQRSNGENHG
jgi:hypothetical protein